MKRPYIWLEKQAYSKVLILKHTELQNRKNEKQDPAMNIVTIIQIKSFWGGVEYILYTIQKINIA